MAWKVGMYGLGGGGGQGAPFFFPFSFLERQPILSKVDGAKNEREERKEERRAFKTQG